MSYKNIQDLLKDMKKKYPKSYRMWLQFQCDEIFELEDKLGMFFSSKDLFDMPFQVAFEGYTSKDIWERDKIKIDLARKNGFNVLVIWDSEYRKNPQQTLQKCIEFING